MLKRLLSYGMAALATWQVDGDTADKRAYAFPKITEQRQKILPITRPPMSSRGPGISQTGVTLLGGDLPHYESLCQMLEGRVRHVSWVLDYQHYRRDHDAPMQHRVRRFCDQLWGTSDPEYLDYAVKSLKDSDSGLIISYWGTLPLPDLIAIKKRLPHIKIVLMVLCHPLALTGAGIRRQDFFMHNGARFLDGIIYPSGEMERYFADHILNRRPLPSVVISPCWPSRLQASTQAQPVSDDPNLVYAGRTDLSHHTIHQADDIRPLMQGILEAGIELHHSYSPEMDDGHPKRKPFAPSRLQEFIQQAGGYDASLIAYNTAACPRDDRFLLTVPDRLITSVTAGVPIAIPKQGYTAAKSYLKEYPAVIEFDTPNELATTLSDRPYVAALREAAWNARSNYVASRHAAKLQNFLEQIL